MDVLERIAAWANANEGLLQAVAMLVVAGGVLLSPLGRWARDRLGGRPERSGRDPRDDADPAAPSGDRASLAVLPFEAASSDPEHEYLVDGLAEAAARDVRPRLDFEELEILLANAAEPLRPIWKELERGSIPSQASG